MYISVWGGLQIKPEVWKRITTAVFMGNCDMLKDTLKDISKVVSALNSVLKVEKPLLLTMRLERDEIRQFLERGIKCFEESELVYVIEVDAYEKSEGVEERDYEDTEIQNVEVRNIHDIKKVLNIVNSGSVPIYNFPVPADTFVKKEKVQQTYRGKTFYVAPYTVDVYGVDSIRIDMYAWARTVVGDVEFRVSTQSIYYKNNANEQDIERGMVEFERLAKKYDVKKRDISVRITIWR